MNCVEEKYHYEQPASLTDDVTLTHSTTQICAVSLHPFEASGQRSESVG